MYAHNTNTIQVVAGTNTASSGTVSFVNSNGVTFGMDSNNNITASAVGGVGGGVALAAGGQTGSSGTVQFVNSNSITFGMSNSSQITASFAQSQITAGANITLSQIGSTITIIGESGGAGAAASAGSQLQTSGTLQFVNSNSITFGMSNSSQLTASYAQTQLTGGSNITLAQAGSTVSIHGPVFVNSNNVTFGTNGNTITASAAGAGAAASAGSQLQTSGTVQFVNSNSITFGMSNSSQITASFAQTQLTGGSNITLAQAGSTVSIHGPVFGNANNVTFGTNGNTITASVNAGGVAVKGSGTYTQNTGTVEFANSNGLTFGLSNNGTMTASYAQSQITAGANITLNQVGSTITIIGAAGGGAAAAAGTQTQTSGTVQFVNSNNVTFGMSNSSQITASASYPAQSVQPVAASASNGSYNFSTIKFVEGSGVTWATQANGIQASVKTDYQSSNANYLTSQSNQAISGSNGSFTFQTVTFGNSNSMSFYSTNGSVVGSYAQSQITAGANITLSQAGSTITIIGASGGGGIAAGLTNTGTTAGNTGTYSSGTVVLAASNSATLSMSTGAGGVHTIWFLPMMMALSGGAGIGLSTTGGTIAIYTV